jgi:hypothetical protein
MKLKFGFVKLRYRGLKKNANRLFATCAEQALFLAQWMSSFPLQTFKFGVYFCSWSPQRLVVLRRWSLSRRYKDQIDEVERAKNRTKSKVTAAAPLSPMTEEGTIVGTFQYMSPAAGRRQRSG